MKIRDPKYTEPARRNPATTCESIDPWYAPVLVTAEMIGERSLRAETIEAILGLYRKLQQDEYMSALASFCADGLRRYGPAWRYCDLVTALFAASELVEPRSYLEIGVRQGRSMAAVVAARPDCDIVGFDFWKKGYAGMDNPGPEFVEKEMKRVGHTGSLELVTGDSHRSVPSYFTAHPDAWFDLITVDGAHTPEGAAEDLANVLPRLKLGGALLFDDISHPAHPQLKAVWDSYFGDPVRFSIWEYRELGYGVGIAVRKV